MEKGRRTHFNNEKVQGTEMFERKIQLVLKQIYTSDLSIKL